MGADGFDGPDGSDGFDGSDGSDGVRSIARLLPAFAPHPSDPGRVAGLGLGAYQRGLLCLRNRLASAVGAGGGATGAAGVDGATGAARVGGAVQVGGAGGAVGADIGAIGAGKARAARLARLAKAQRLLRRLVVTSAALGEESVVLKQFDRAAEAYQVGSIANPTLAPDRCGVCSRLTAIATSPGP